MGLAVSLLVALYLAPLGLWVYFRCTDPDNANRYDEALNNYGSSFDKPYKLHYTQVYEHIKSK